MGDLISRQQAIDALRKNAPMVWTDSDYELGMEIQHRSDVAIIETLPSSKPTLYGYNIGHLKLIAEILQIENLPPERLAEALTDIGRIVEIVKDEFEEALRKAVEQ